MAASQRRLAAIMFTDMVGYSALAQADEEVALAVLERHNRLLRPLFPRFRGREIKTVGDAFLVEFDSALEAAQCAIEIQRVLHEYNLSSTDEWKVRIRIGIHVGDVMQTSGDVLGDAVNLASRIEPLADPEGICITQQVYDQIQNKIHVTLVKLPSTHLKNIRTPVNVYRIVQPWDPSEGPVAAGVPMTGRQLAVLPLANISPDPNDEYFADGLTEELISVLSQVSGLSVIARTSVAPYKAAPKSIAQIGEDLGVDSVIEGSVRKAGNRMRITLQLIDVATQGHIWANSYDREVGDVFAVQSDIAKRTAEALRLELTPSGPSAVPRSPTSNPIAYDYYLKGLVAASVHTKKGLDEAVGWFERATSLDPAFAEAYASWSNAYVSAAGDFVAMREVMPKARELADRALALDPNSSDAHSSLANALFQFDHDWKRSEEEFLRAIALNPSNLTAHRFYCMMLFALQRFEEAKTEIRRTIQLDPAGGHEGFLAWAEIDSGNLEAGLELSKRVRPEDAESFDHHFFLATMYLSLGRTADAAREFEAFPPDPDGTRTFDRALVRAILGHPEDARAELAKVERGEDPTYTSASHLAMMYAVLGEKDRAIALLEKEYEEGDRVLWLYYRGVFFDSLRDDPRFVALLRRYGLPDRPVRRPSSAAS